MHMYMYMRMHMLMLAYTHAHACLQPLDLVARGLVELGELLPRGCELLVRDRQLLLHGLGLAHLPS
jgi:hypothetical protein